MEEAIIFGTETPLDRPADLKVDVYAIAVAPYTGAADGEELLWLAEYLLRVADCPNLRALDKRRWREVFTRKGKEEGGGLNRTVISGR